MKWNVVCRHLHQKLKFLYCGVVGYKFCLRPPTQLHSYFILHLLSLCYPFNLSLFILPLFNNGAKKDGMEIDWTNQLKWNSFAAEGWAPSHNPPQESLMKESKSIQSTNSLLWLIVWLLSLSIQEKEEWIIGQLTRAACWVLFLCFINKSIPQRKLTRPKRVKTKLKRYFNSTV